MSAAAQHTEIVAVIGAVAGAGRTTLAANLAVLLARGGRQVTLIDACRAPPMRERDRPGTILPILAAAAVHGVPIETGLERLGIAGVRTDAGSAVAPHAERSPAKISAVAPDAPFVLVDTPAGFHASLLDVVRVADRLLLVATPAPASIVRTYALLKSLRAAPPPVSRPPAVCLVLNHVRRPAAARAATARIIRAAARFLALEICDWGLIPHDRRIPAAARAQQPPVVRYPASCASRAIAALSAKLRPVEPRERPVFTGWSRVASLFL